MTNPELRQKQLEQSTQRNLLSMKMFPKTQVINYVLSIRKFNGKLAYKICLYTEDEEYLVIAAGKYSASHTFIISTSSREVEETGLFFVGKLKYHGRNTYLGSYSVNFNGPQFIPNSKIVLDKANKTMTCAMPAPDGQSYLADGTVPDGTTEIIFNTSTINFEQGALEFVVEHDEKVCLRMKQIHVDEFAVSISHPLSLFQAMAYMCSFLDHAYHF
ncbi:hypothetical protein TVAG_298310 [Trichomonas vaginalis G3]|uniref:Tubby C-terminal domain-containing protein n=1 Tax=Trichomonas vaginalis (strain ATCC PRA-98 / G3) TaxID=412133 RepID=A2ET22_TRIV3|nr:hypothetical protein TVAGG3_1034000 [Trichomonas vaginalis G3]EAY04211.1 hypothetical protein TVAG_298310 [Trichomonas vaginalis G3]KAI5493085.1 hypothetical protein TVAGG3_1034000 [Trichomonas vaginalis G3]|eukprot:XP_001316434.1 hypothetical protein [Trichomonas vaginalis G3]